MCLYRISRYLADEKPTIARILALVCHRLARLRDGSWINTGWYQLHHLIHIADSRYLHARRLLARGRFDRYERILLTDVRDVVFESDPFEKVGHGLHTGLENRTIKDLTPNSWWINRLLESWREIDTIRDQTTICSGVTIGGREAAVGYLDLMGEQILEALPVLAFEFGPQFGYDQGIHNCILRGSHHLPLTLKENGSSDLIATLDNSNLAEFRFNEQGELCNRAHSPVAIVHKYDRHAELARKVSSRSAGPDKIPSPHAVKEQPA